AMISGKGQDEIQHILLEADSRKLGIVKIWNFINWVVYVSNVEYAKQIFLESADVLPKWSYKEGQPIKIYFGTGIALSNGEHWAKHRKIATTAFNKALYPEATGMCTLEFTKILDQCTDTPTDIFKLIQLLTLQILGKLVFNHDLQCLNSLEEKPVFLDTYRKIVKHVINPLFVLLPWLVSLPLKANVEHEMRVKEFDQFLYDIIEKRRIDLAEQKRAAMKIENRDLLAGMIEDAENEGYDIPDKEFRDDIIVFFLAAHDSSSSALCYSFYFLAKYPEIQRKARNEAIRVLGKDVVIPDSKQLKELKYITAIIKETLRLYPTLTVISPRIAAKELKYGPYTLPKGQSLAINLWQLQRNLDLWKNTILKGFWKKKRVIKVFLGFLILLDLEVGKYGSKLFSHATALLQYEISLPPNSPHKDKILLNSWVFTAPQKLNLVFTKLS
ncbi:7405_t:CDS:10, partial [Gigaspora rosea]